jgi:hypothetical protein
MMHCNFIWSFTPREKHRLKVFQNRVPRRIFEPERKGNRRLVKTAQGAS